MYSKEYMKQWLANRTPEQIKSRKEYNKKYRENNKEYFAAYRKSYNTINIKKKRKWEIEAYRRDRKIVLDYYGHKCVCCGESTYEFLALDHINNDGNVHRAKLGKSPRKILRWIIANNFPTTIQILCHNCNCAKAFYGNCPHNNTRA